MDFKAKHIILFIIGFILVVVIIQRLFETPSEYIETTFKPMEFKGILYEKYREPANHDMRFVRIISNIDTLLLDIPCNFDFWNFVQKNDSIFKERNSYLITVKRWEKTFSFDMRCPDDREVENSRSRAFATRAITKQSKIIS